MTTAAEAFIGTGRTFDETQDLVRDALTARMRQASGALYCYVYIADISAEDVVYTCADGDDLMQCSYAIADDASVSLGVPTEVVRTYAPADTVRNPPPEDEEMPAPLVAGEGPDTAEEVAMESARVPGRLIEAKGTNSDGGRVFRTRIIAYGDSKNGRRYPEAVMREAVGLYEGAKAYDHHRTAEELQTSTISGMVGHYRDVQAEADGLYGDLHLLPSATHAAEALDASLAAQDAGHEPSVGISHDVQAHFKPIVANGRRMQEAVQVASVTSADVVANPSAGGKAVRAVAGGEQTIEENPEETDVTVTTEAVLAALQTASPEQLAAHGLAKAASVTESTQPTTLQRAVESDTATERTTEADTLAKTSALGRMLIRSKLDDAHLPASVTESVTAALPDRFVEADVDAQIASLQAALGLIEREGLRPTVTTTVVQESFEKKKDALDRFFAGDFTGFRSFKEAFIEISGKSPKSAFTEDFNRIMMRESIGEFDSGDRTTESMSASSWNLVLGDSITRRLVAEYNQPDLQNWRNIVSSFVPVNDFRTQRIDRIGGYGTLPAVNQGAPYQPLTSPTNEELTYAITKRGGTEDVTLEMIANDDVRAISRIPKKLGLAAANTLYQFVWNFVTTAAGTASNSGPTIYDSTTLFTNNAGHANYVNNGAGSALSQSALSAGRLLMRSQTAYGDTQQFIAPTPRFLVVVNDIEELAWQLVTSAVALPTPANTPPDSTGAANTPNLHQGLSLIVLDYIPNATSTTAWWLVGNPDMIPTIEIGFYQGQQDPALFTQSDPTVGSVFNADKVTYKIRHIYSGAVLDFRPFVKGNV